MIMNSMLISVLGVSKYITILFKLIDLDPYRSISFKKTHHKTEMTHQFIHNISAYKKTSYLVIAFAATSYFC